MLLFSSWNLFIMGKFLFLPSDGTLAQLVQSAGWRMTGQIRNWFIKYWVVSSVGLVRRLADDRVGQIEVLLTMGR
jgi:hypothetical protein